MSSSGLTTHQKRLIVRRILTGKSTTTEEQEKTGVNRGTIAKWCKDPELRDGVEISEDSSFKPRRRFELSFKHAAVARVQAGESVPQVADELGIEHATLYQWIKGRGLERGVLEDPNYAVQEEAAEAGETSVPEADKRRGPRKWTDEIKIEVVQRWLNNETVQALCAEYGIAHEQQIYQWASSLGMTKGSSSPAQQQRRVEVLDDFNAGTPVKDLAAKHRVNVNTIYKWIGDAMVSGGAQPSAPAQESLPMDGGEDGARVETTVFPAGFLPTRKVSPEIAERQRRIPKKILTRYACPHCTKEVPPPPRALPGQLIATQFACPGCQGVIII